MVSCLHTTHPTYLIHLNTYHLYLLFKTRISLSLSLSLIMGSNQVQLLGAWPSPYVLRCRIALNIKSTNYQFLEETFGSKSDLLLKSNPVHKKIPVLIHAGRPICESLIIVEYIDQVWPSAPTLLPSDPYDRATARFWAAFVDQVPNTSSNSCHHLMIAHGDEARNL